VGGLADKKINPAADTLLLIVSENCLVTMTSMPEGLLGKSS